MRDFHKQVTYPDRDTQLILTFPYRGRGVGLTGFQLVANELTFYLVSRKLAGKETVTVPYQCCNDFGHIFTVFMKSVSIISYFSGKSNIRKWSGAYTPDHDIS